MTIRTVETETGVDVVAFDSSGTEIGRSTAEWRAEVHVKIGDMPPAAKWSLLKLLHDSMEKEMRRRNVREVVTWFAAEESFCKRLISLGWIKSTMIPFVREVR